jgi:hypothetical protein
MAFPPRDAYERFVHTLSWKTGVVLFLLRTFLPNSHLDPIAILSLRRFIESQSSF